MGMGDDCRTVENESVLVENHCPSLGGDRSRLSYDKRLPCIGVLMCYCAVALMCGY